MSSLSLLNPLPDPMEEIRRLRRENESLKSQLESANQEIHSNRQFASMQAEGVQNLRAALSPLFLAMKRIFGEMERSGFETFDPAPKNTVVWDSWKQKLGGHTAKAIDVLMLHGSMNRTQLRIHLGCATGTVTNVVAALNKAGIINKNGNEISLKTL
jgi:hypothetical protein